MRTSRSRALEMKQAKLGEFQRSAKSEDSGTTVEANVTRVSIPAKGTAVPGAFVPATAILEKNAWALERAISEARSISVLGSAIAGNPEPASPELARSLQAEENWWRRIENELPSLSSTEAAAFLGASPTNRNFASAQRAAGKLLGYARRHAIRYPRFQFDPRLGTVLPVIPRLLAVTRGLKVQDEDLVLWMAARSSAFADQRRPVDHLNDPERLLAAAEAHFGASW